MKITSDREIFLIDLLLQEFKGASRTSIKKIIGHGNISVNGKKITNPVFLLKPADCIEYQKYRMTANTQGAPFPILYEDDQLLFIEKPAGILTYGERGTVGTSLYKMLLDYLRERSKGRERIYVVHRLDKEVSGIVLFAKSEEVQQKIKEKWKETEKVYYALVEGKPKETEGTISNWLKETSTQKMYITQDPEGAKLAITHYKVLKDFPAHTLLEIKIETGRKNQIRVQLAGIGCPVAGDHKYGSKDPFKRQVRLHAYHFTFHHPVTGEPLIIESPLPKGFLKLHEKNEKYK
jgi:23S rRNA pseudouridine1911/1915/1917 synthase